MSRLLNIHANTLTAMRGLVLPCTFGGQHGLLENGKPFSSRPVAPSVYCQWIESDRPQHPGEGPA